MQSTLMLCMSLQGTILLSLMDIASGMKYLHSLGIVHR